MIRYWPNPLPCCVCGAEKTVMYHVRNDLWRACVKPNQRRKIICLTCFAKLKEGCVRKPFSITDLTLAAINVDNYEMILKVLGEGDYRATKEQMEKGGWEEDR